MIYQDRYLVFSLVSYKNKGTNSLYEVLQSMLVFALASNLQLKMIREKFSHSFVTLNCYDFCSPLIKDHFLFVENIERFQQFIKESKDDAQLILLYLKFPDRIIKHVTGTRFRRHKIEQRPILTCN